MSLLLLAALFLAPQHVRISSGFVLVDVLATDDKGRLVEAVSLSP